MNNPSSTKDVGIGLRHRHFKEVIEGKPNVAWLEVHTENFFSSGSAASLLLEEVADNYPLSAHCVGLSLGSHDEVSEDHLKNVKSFCNRFSPFMISDHLSWSASGEHHLPDLLPIPYTKEALKAVCRNITTVQEFLQRQILIENPSSYLAFSDSPIPEHEFLVEAAKISGCGILLDINNIYVSAHNHSFDADIYLEHIPIELVQEIHLAGYSENEIDGETVLIDDHGARVYDDVWNLYAKAVKKFRNSPTLIEWDTNVPELSILLEEAEKAKEIANSAEEKAA